VRKSYLLHLIESGKGQLERENEIIPLQAGEAFLIRPDEVTTYRADKNDPWVYRWISFSGTYATTLVEKTTDLTKIPYRESGLIALKNALESGFNDTLSALHTLLEVLNSIKTVVSIEQPNAFQTALRYLEYNYFLPINIDELAKRHGYSRAHFSVAFKAHTGKTPYAYLLHVRLREAKNLLAKTELGVEEIAFSTGFSSVVRFSATFKTHVGVSPLAYRRSFKKG
jgi:AraC-like DNA-binding protein